MNNGILCINKPTGMTSNAVVMQVKRLLATQKVGHTGTLDPQATGVLVLLVNQATKALPFLDITDKVYLASCQLGIKTDTGDIWGETTNESDINMPTETELKSILQSFVGEYWQTPPMVSAKKVNGKKLYEMARSGQHIERKPTQQFIHSIELISIQESVFSFRVHVSSGTYIRTLCEDLCATFKQLGTMSSLCREQVGQFSLNDCLELSEINEEVILQPIIDLINLEQVDCTDFVENVYHGKRIQLENSQSDQVLLTYQGQALAVYQRENKQQFKSVRGLW